MGQEADLRREVDGLNLAEAEKFADLLEKLFQDHGVFYRMAKDCKPDVRFIEFEKVSIKIDKPRGRND